MSQKFKGDDIELKFFNSGLNIMNQVSNQKNLFFDEAFSCFVLGDLLYDNNLSPLSNAIPRDVYRESFFSLFESFVVAGTFESYLSVFRSVFGDDVEVTFTVSSPGILGIDIVAAGVQEYLFQSRLISGNEYVYDDIVDDEGDNIVFRGFKGLESQYELEQMLFEMVPAGIYTEITLTLGEE